MGFVEGFMAAQQLKNQRAANARAEQANMRAQQQHQMNMRKQQMMLQQMKQEIQFQRGRDMAVQQGGVEGLKDYLMKTRPKEGLALQQQQEALNQSIMKTMQAKQAVSSNEMSLFSQKQKILGGVYAQVMNADQKVRQQVYQDALPQIRKLDPDAPDQFDPGRAMMAIGQAIPANQLYSNQKRGLELKTDIGKAEQDKQAFLNAGYPKDHPTIKALDEKITGAQEKQAQISAESAKLKAQHLNDINAQANIYRKELIAASKDYLKIQNQYTNIQKSLQAKTGAGDMSAIFQFMKVLDPESTVREGEFANARNTSKIPAWLMNMYNGIASNNVSLKEDVREDFRKRSNEFFNTKTNEQGQLVDSYRKLLKQDNIPEDKVIPDYLKPSNINKVNSINKFQKFLAEKYNGLTLEEYIQKAQERNPKLSREQLLDMAIQKHMKGAK